MTLIIGLHYFLCRRSFSIDSNSVEGHIVAGKTASHMPFYQIAELETAVLGAATGPGTGLVSLEKSSVDPIELGRRRGGAYCLCSLL